METPIRRLLGKTTTLSVVRQSHTGGEDEVSHVGGTELLWTVEWGSWKRWKKDVLEVYPKSENAGGSETQGSEPMLLKDYFKPDKVE